MVVLCLISVGLLIKYAILSTEKGLGEWFVYKIYINFKSVLYAQIRINIQRLKFKLRVSLNLHFKMEFADATNSSVEMWRA